MHKEQTMPRLTEEHEQTILNALRVAADVYEKDATAVSSEVSGLSGQFTRQAEEARRLADSIEAEGIESFL
jgi:hypothetical protein